MAIKFLILFVLYFIPNSLKAEINIPPRKNCENQKDVQTYKYYEMQEAHDFGRKIQTLIAKRDLKGIYKNVLLEELVSGPRKAFVKDKSFNEIFPRDWVSKIISSQIPCNSTGWRGFEIGNGLIWYDMSRSGKWTIKSINNVKEEKFDTPKISGWRTNKGLISPTCFPTFSYFETPKLDSFTKEFNIKNKIDFRNSPGKYIGETIPLGYKIIPKEKQTGSNYPTYSVSLNLKECFKYNLEEGFANKKPGRPNLIEFENIIYLKNNQNNLEKYNRYKSHYEVIKKIDLKSCNKLIPQLPSKCKEAYFIRIGYQTGGTIGWLGGYYIFGIVKEENNEYIIPIKFFSLRNVALNFLENLK